MEAAEGSGDGEGHPAGIPPVFFFVCNKVHEKHGRIALFFPFHWGNNSKGNSPMQLKTGSNELMSFLSFYDTFLLHFTHSAKHSLYISIELIPSALHRGCIQHKIISSKLLNLLRQQLLSSSCLKITTLLSTFHVPFNSKSLLHHRS